MLHRLPVVLALFAAVGLLTAAPVPKEKEDKPGPITEEQLKDGRQRMRDFGIALHNHNDTFGVLPHNITTKDGKPGLSWRVAILPFLEQDHLYKQFKLDEAWDSDHNKKLVEKMPDIYAPIRVKTKEKGMTFYQGFDGADATFEAGKKLRIPASFPDGTSNTVAIVEAGEPVVWTKPDDVKFDAAKAVAKLGGLFDGDFHAVCMDGACYFAKGKDLDEKQFKLAVTKSDGTVLDLNAALGLKK